MTGIAPILITFIINLLIFFLIFGSSLNTGKLFHLLVCVLFSVLGEENEIFLILSFIRVS